MAKITQEVIQQTIDNNPGNETLQLLNLFEERMKEFCNYLREHDDDEAGDASGMLEQFNGEKE